MASFSIAEEVTAAQALVRSDSSPETLCVARFTADGSAVELQATDTGERPEDALAALVSEDACAFALLRKVYTYESVGNVAPTTTKFTYVFWRPESLPVRVRMSLPSKAPRIKESFSPTHANIEAESVADFTTEVLQDLLMHEAKIARPSADRQIREAKAETEPTVHNFLPTGTGADTAGTARAGVRGAEVRFADAEEFKAQLAKVRSDSESDDWCLYGYQMDDPKVLVRIASGSGGFNALLQAVELGRPAYGLFRVTDQYDMTVNVKFCMVTYMPEEGVAPLARAAMSTHKGFVANAFSPSYYSFVIRAPGEDEWPDEATIKDHIASITGTKQGRTDQQASIGVATIAAPGASSAAAPGASSERLGGAPTTAQTLSFTDEDALRAALARVRSDDTPETYAIAEFEGTSLKLVACGEGSMADVVDNLSESTFCFALYRLVEVIDASTTTKFAYVRYTPDSVPLQTKGRLGIFTGACAEVFSPYHGSIATDDTADITDEAALTAVSNLRAAAATTAP